MTDTVRLSPSGRELDTSNAVDTLQQDVSVLQSEVAEIMARGPSEPVMGLAPTWLEPGRPGLVKIEGPVIPASGSLEVMNVAGAGYVTYIFMSVRSTDINGRKKTRCRVYVNDEVSPSVDVEVQDMACARSVEGSANSNTAAQKFKSTLVGYMSGAFAFNGTGYYLYITIPFATRIRVVFVNGSTTTDTILGGYIHYNLRDGLSWGRYGKLWGQSLNALSVAPYAEQNLINVTSGKPGALHATYLHLSGGDANYNYLEGNMLGYVDGEGVASIHYDSTEDYFHFPWYFWEVTSTTNSVSTYVGCTRKNDSALVGAYKFHIQDRIPWESSFRFTWKNGENGIGVPVNTNTTVDGVVWYYTAL